MFSALLIIMALPILDLSRSRGIQFRPLSKIAFFVFVSNFLVLMQLGAKHVETPFIEFGQISTVLYFSYFLIIIPCISLLENSLIELPSNVKEPSSTNNPSYYSLAKSNINSLLSLLLVGTIFVNEYNSSINLCDVPTP
jgi:ubiquinol-cytochrome c reductase cytochrome b subunit